MWVQRDAATAFAHRGCIRISTHRSLLVHLCERRTAAVRVPGSAQLLLSERPMPFFDLRIRRAESSDFGPKSDLGPSDSQSDVIMSDFAIISDCIRRPIYFSD